MTQYTVSYSTISFCQLLISINSIVTPQLPDFKVLDGFLAHLKKLGVIEEASCKYGYEMTDLNHIFLPIQSFRFAVIEIYGRTYKTVSSNSFKIYEVRL